MLLGKAQKYFLQHRWQLALDAYKLIDAQQPGDLNIKIQIASCLLNLGRYDEALLYAVDSTKQFRACWKLMHIAAICLRMTGKLPVALILLEKLYQQYPKIAEIRRDYGDYICKTLGDWKQAERIWRPLSHLNEFDESYHWFKVKRNIYEGATSSTKITRQIQSFSSNFLTNSVEINKNTKIAICKPRRVGLISTFFRASPVYYLCFGSLYHLSKEFELIFFFRETIKDWATDEFQSLAAEWYDVKHLDVTQLNTFLKNKHLDVLIDMSGWLDRDALKAMSTRPAKRLLKWVGGQSTTTGLRCFDGYITDKHQSPYQYEYLYTEPLKYLDSGYVSYTAPPYMPLPCIPTNSQHWNVGIISHPMKVSRVFIQRLKTTIIHTSHIEQEAIVLYFIGWRYGLKPVQNRILKTLQTALDQASNWLSIKFIATDMHKGFLFEVAKLDWVIDSAPYTCGVTALDTLALGVPIRTRAGELFCQRHAFSHCRYAGLSEKEFDLDKLGYFKPPEKPKSGNTLLPVDCARMNHINVALSLAEVIDNV